MKNFIVTTVSTFKMVYIVPAETEEAARQRAEACEITTEFSQEHLVEKVVDAVELKPLDLGNLLVKFRKENAYLASWTDEQILKVLGL